MDRGARNWGKPLSGHALTSIDGDPQVGLELGPGEPSWKRNCGPLLSPAVCPCLGPSQAPTCLPLLSPLPGIEEGWEQGMWAGEHGSPEWGLRNETTLPLVRLMGKSQEKSWAPTQPPPRPFMAPPTWPSLPATGSCTGTALWRKPFGRPSSLAEVSRQVKVKTGALHFTEFTVLSQMSSCVICSSPWHDFMCRF